MDKRFLEAFLTPSRTRLLGRLLYPWCLKHRLQLTALGNPFVCGGDISPGDILVFSKVCSESGMRSGIKDRLQAWKMARGWGSGYVECLRVAKDHMREGAWPRFWDRPATEGGDPRNNGMPWVLSILTNLVKNGVSLEEALHIPECQAIWMSSAFGIQQGAKLEFLTTEDEALLDHLSTVEKPKKDEPKPTV